MGKSACKHRRCTQALRDVTRAAYSCFRPSGLKQLAKLDPGWTRGLTCPAAQAKVQLRKNLAGCQVAIRHSPHQVNAPTR